MPDSRKDFLAIYDGDSKSAPLMAYYEFGDTLQSKYNSSGNEIFIKFSTGIDYEDVGFMLKYHLFSKFKKMSRSFNFLLLIMLCRVQSWFGLKNAFSTNAEVLKANQPYMVNSFPSITQIWKWANIYRVFWNFRISKTYLLYL